MVWPGRTTAAALPSVAYGWAMLPSPASLPPGATKMSAVVTPSPWGSGDADGSGVPGVLAVTAGRGGFNAAAPRLGGAAAIVVPGSSPGVGVSYTTNAIPPP